MWAIGEPSGPIENGTTYIVRPAHRSRRTGPSSVSRISAGSRQLLVGPASSSRSRADERAVLDARDVAGVRAARGRSSGAWRRRAARTCRRRRAAWQSRSYSSAEPSHQWIVVGLGQRGDLLDPGAAASLFVVGASVARWLTCSSFSLGIANSSIAARYGAILPRSRVEPLGGRRRRAVAPGCLRGTSTSALELGHEHAVLVEDARVDLDDAAVGLRLRRP